MRLHVVGLPHTQTTRAYDWCAYTAKCRRLPTMLQPYGHPVLLYSYGADESAAEHVSLGPAEGWDRTVVFDDWEPASPRWRSMNARVIAELEERLGPEDAIGLIAGLCQQQIADRFPNHLVLEWGVGYQGVLPNSHRAYESHAWRHYVYGTTGQFRGRFFDAVIPNAFDPDDLLFSDDPDDYLLYLGRPTVEKGLEVVQSLAREFRVVTAGQSDPGIDGAEYVGLVMGHQKADLLAGARAVLVPTFYIEPFGGVAVEAMLSGTPAITTDFGAFPETVAHGLSGFRCATLPDFHTAAGEVGRLDRRTVREWAEQFTLARVAPKYSRWLHRCATLYGTGWY